ncbi:MAG: endolytic transglycosylase MltG [Proteobacteria bacterium]|nr:endolytic transglycosylase MltG [Desulfobacterales bacterium]MBL6967856.1 endolytic transglycosylase MltG [Desulfobacteraceae bacterium]MBL7101720.1 endolytic transglycosylase MltG [Desulfobacteraceae bacterium]MBL7172898.1 endolytic transglycosylase MltG [Desulfobacteraceae bacterium]MBU1905195.1 endolytic transglycosylase MltG [Pseudomonadota bacterium]
MSIHTKRVIFFGFILILMVGVLMSVGVARFLVHPAKKKAPDQIFFVREGATLREVVGDLEKKGIITNKTPLLLWSRLTGYGSKIKAGEYRLNSGMAPLKVLNILSRGIIITHPITIPEGFTIRQIAEGFAEKGLADRAEFLALADNPEIVKGYAIPGPSLEGYLYPDTYRFGRGQPTRLIVDVMVNRFFDIIAPLRQRIEASGMTLRQVITMASLIEKETGLSEERPVIASVFLNRLRKGMRLDSDPTVIYGLRDFDGNLTSKDLDTPTPYNTYVIKGLPLGPIANPGKEAIKAVLYPANTDYLYFVSKNDGSHHFSRTLAEHNRAVRMYQKKGRGARTKTS